MSERNIRVNFAATNFNFKLSWEPAQADAPVAASPSAPIAAAEPSRERDQTPVDTEIVFQGRDKIKSVPKDNEDNEDEEDEDDEDQEDGGVKFRGTKGEDRKRKTMNEEEKE